MVTITELALLLDDFVVRADAMSALALADAMEELGHAEAAKLLRTGRIKNTRVVLPPLCEYPQCRNAAKEFVAPVASDDCAAMCNMHARFVAGPPGELCMNCRCRLGLSLDAGLAPGEHRAGEVRGYEEPRGEVGTDEWCDSP